MQTVEAKGTTKPLSHDAESVKSKQYAKTADNPYKTLAVYVQNGQRVFNVLDYSEQIRRSNMAENLSRMKLFELISCDLVYVPTIAEMNKKDFSILDMDKERIYKFISSSVRSTSNTPNVYFVPHRIADFIFNEDKSEKYKLEYSIPKKQKSTLQGELNITSAGYRTEIVIPNIIDGKCVEMPTIRDICWKLEVDRLGNITKIIR